MINSSSYKNDFDAKAATWDTQEKIERAQIVADAILTDTTDNKLESAFEYGCGTGLVSFALREKIQKIVLADISDGMLSVLNSKIQATQAVNLFPVKLDLTIDSPPLERYDLIYTLQTLHHIRNTTQIIQTFYAMLNEKGRLFIADLDFEDGSFHGEGFEGHNGFIREELREIALSVGFKHIKFQDIYSINKINLVGENRTYPLFLMIADK